MSGQGRLSDKDKHNNATDLGKLPQDVVTKLGDKLSELMGEDIRGELNELNNARGEVLNEEGLPIIDITEPVEASVIEEENVASVEELVLPPLHLLPEHARERLRQERNSLLDQLEEEERAHQKREKSADMEHREEILRKRKEEAAKEKEKLNATREMHKKMGRMLLQNLAKEREQEEKARVADAASDKAKRSSQGGKSKKTVSFADTPDVLDERASKGQRTSDRGDITPARLRATGKPSPLSSSNDLPMKMDVVERIPSAPPKLFTKNVPDSDDESDLEAHLDAEESDPEVTLEDEEYDAEFAHHQREIALQYHEKREKIGAAALAALEAHSHDESGHDLPLDVPSYEPGKPSVSQFKASRLASSYAASSPSTSIGASVVPASAARTIQKTVKTGKIDDNDQLVGGDADSASEDETTENAQELLSLLRRGELYNIGPDGNYLHVDPPSDGGQRATETPSLPSAIGRAIPKDLTPIDRPKTSKFKLSRASGQHSPFRRSSNNDAPIPIAERSSPNMPMPMNSSVVERKPMTRHLAVNPSVSEPLPSGQASVANRRPAVPGDQIVPSSTFSSVITDSPSFPVPIPVCSVPANEPTSLSSPSPMIIDSPSFPKYTVPEVHSRPTRPPVVISSGTREASEGSAGLASTASQSRRTDKVSRFMADRT